jgi:tetratricopeptide (TPR) repeat protein
MTKLFFFVLLFPVVVLCQTDYEKAEKLFRQEKYQLARPIFENYLKESPNNLKTLEYLGDIEGNSKSWDKTIFYYDKLKKLKPSEANYYYKYGGALGMKAKDGGAFVAIGLIGDMRRSFEKAIALNPKHIDARWALIEYYLQLPGFVGGSEKKAQRYANELLVISPVDGYLAKGHIDEYFEHLKSAERNYIKAVEVGGSKMTYERLAELYKYKLHLPEKAKSVLDEYVKKNQIK